MLEQINHVGFALILGIIIYILLRLFLFPKKTHLPDISPTSTTSDDQDQRIQELENQCQRLREELKQQSRQIRLDFQNETFTQLQTLLSNYPTVQKMVLAKPDLPAKNLVSLFTPLENILASWGYVAIGKPWEQVNYNPQLHQADSEDIQEGELVYIRFIGYQDGEKILYPAKVSRTIPGGYNQG
ncbi:MAG: molecular chaperone GrpE [Nostoc sp.]|uniref:nucleotide exchange factor GrpE n=1 Tax=Nostoc sp. TaxID=1180 RepID=UPI002FFC854F